MLLCATAKATAKTFFCLRRLSTRAVEFAVIHNFYPPGARRIPFVLVVRPSSESDKRTKAGDFPSL